MNEIIMNSDHTIAYPFEKIKDDEKFSLLVIKLNIEFCFLHSREIYFA
jgi:hypothetical protein